MLPSFAELVKALYGTVLLARRHPDAAAMFNRTPEGFWNSLFAAVLALPAHAAIVARGMAYTGRTEYGPLDAVIDLMIYAIVWLAWPVLMAGVSSALGRGERFIDYIVPYNWVSAPIAYMFAAASLTGLYGVAPPGVEAVVTALCYTAATLMFVEVARRQLGLGIIMSFAIVVLDFVFSVAVVKVLESFAGKF